MRLVSMSELDNLGSFLIKIVVLTGLLSDSLLLEDKLSDVDTGRFSVLLDEIGQLLQVLVEVFRALDCLKEGTLPCDSLSHCFQAKTLSISVLLAVDLESLTALSDTDLFQSVLHSRNE